MTDIDVQLTYWDAVAASKQFTHPLPVSVFHTHLPATARILDYGCGYGRVCRTLSDSGYGNVIGIDISEKMVLRGSGPGGLDLRVFDGISAGFDDGSFDACLAMALFTCMPSDSGQERAIAEIERLLTPGGLFFLSDYPLQQDMRNQTRYRQFAKEFGTFGVFRTEEAVFRHFDMQRIHTLLRHFDIVWEQNVTVRTMNGHVSDIFQLLARKK